MFTALMLVLSPVPQEPQQSAIAPEVIHRVEPGIAGGFSVVNPGHRMIGHFSDEGVSLQGEGWSAGLSLAAWGRTGAMSPAASVDPAAEACRVEYRRPGITEWYVNGPRGLEQGFTLDCAPEGDGPVRIEVAVDGELEVEVLAGQRDARLLDDGRAVFHYVGLTAWDATGRHLAAALSAVEGGLALEVLDQGAVYPLTVDPWMGTEVAVLTLAAWPWYEEGQDYGFSIALQGDTLAVGAPNTDIAGVKGAGAVRIHYRNAGGPDSWGEVVPPLAEPLLEFLGNFGYSVALDGDTLVVTALGQFSAEESVHVFERNQGGPDAWGHVKELAAELTGVGPAVAIDGDTLVVDGYDGTGASVFIFGRNAGGPGNWGLVQGLSSQSQPPVDFGLSLAVEGDTLLVGQRLMTPPGTDTVEVFERIDGVWTGVQSIISEVSQEGYGFGRALALDGDSLLVGAPFTDPPGLDGAGAAYYFEHVAGAWVLLQKLTPSTPASKDYFGESIALLGDTALIGAPFRDGLAGADSGASYLFRWEAANGAWEEKQELTASNGGGHYGYSVALDGTRGAIGASSFSQGTVIGTIRSAAFDPLSGTVYGVSTSSPEGLVRIDTSTGAGMHVGPTGFQLVLGLAFDPGAGILYATDDVTRLIQIDTSTGAGQVIGDTGFDRIQGLAFDTSAGVLYGIDAPSDNLVRIDPATGAAVAVGPTAPQVHGLDYDSWTDTLYGSDHVADQLLAIDKHTGTTTLVGQLGFPRVEGLAFDAASGTLYGIDWTEKGTLITIDTSSGAGTAVGQISTFQSDVGAAYVIAIEFEAETYCTAGTSASGCQALIGATGSPSASASSGFFLTISGVEGQKEGLFFCGTNGKQANPWGNGTSFVCVVPPRWRAGLLTGVGTVGACDGSFSQDLNAHWCATCPKPLHNPGVGALAQAQLWYRDPASTSNQTSSMSDAIEFLVGP